MRGGRRMNVITEKVGLAIVQGVLLEMYREEPVESHCDRVLV